MSPNGSVLVSPRVINSTNGTTVTFTCEEEGGLDNVFDWRYIRTGEIVSNTSTLTLVSSASIGGDYLCEVSNQAGLDTANGTLNGMKAFLLHLHVQLIQFTYFLQSLRSYLKDLRIKMLHT